MEKTIDTDKTRSKLEAERESLLVQIEQGEEKLKPKFGENPDRGSLAQTYNTQQIKQAQHDRRLDRLAQVEAALTRLEAGIYGTCENCSDPIAAERLLALPQTTLCLDCSAEEEEYPPYFMNRREG